MDIEQGSDIRILSNTSTEDVPVILIKNERKTPDEHILKFLVSKNFNIKTAHLICNVFGVMDMSGLQEYVNECMPRKENLIHSLIVEEYKEFLLEEEIERILVIMTRPLPPLQMSYKVGHLPR